MNGLDLKIKREKLGLTQEELAKMIKVSRKTINSYENSGNIPEAKVTFINMVLGDLETKRYKKENVTVENEIVSNHNNVGVPYYDVDFAGGWDSEEIFSNHMPSFYITSPDFMKAQFACNLFGNSISNRIPSGAIIGLREIFDWQTYFPTNELYAVLTKNDLRTVKIVKRSQKEGYLTLIPDPKDQFNQIGYEPEEIPIEFISKFYQVVAWAQFERVAM